jgi:hypothetical protein
MTKEEEKAYGRAFAVGQGSKPGMAIAELEHAARQYATRQDRQQVVSSVTTQAEFDAFEREQIFEALATIEQHLNGERSVGAALDSCFRLYQFLKGG